MTRYVSLGATDVTQQTIDQASKVSAEAVADQIAPRGTKQHNIAKGAALWSMRQLDQQIEAFSKTHAGQIVRSAGNVADGIGKMVTSAKNGEYSGDSSGVFNIARDGFSLIENVSGLVTKLGGDQRVMQEVTSWASVGATCAVGAGVPVWGWLACGLSALTKLFSYLDPSGPYQEDWNTPRTVFRPHENSVGLIAQDALRLSQVLKHHYGVDSLASLHNRLGNGSLDIFRWITQGYPYKPKVSPDGRIVSENNEPIPGHNLRTILQMLDLQRRTPADAHDNTRDGLAVLAAYRTGVEPAGRGLFLRYESDHDINQKTIANGAYFARSGIGTQGHARLRCRVYRSGNLRGWPKSTLGWSAVTVDFRPFLVVDELINFFGAVTAREIVTFGLRERREVINSYGFGTLNPTRHLFVADLPGHQTGQPGSGRRSYSKECWTNLSRATGARCNLHEALVSGSVPDEALREAGAIRLMAAFSFMLQQWKWSSIYEQYRSDPVKEIVKSVQRDVNGLARNPADEMVLPIDPRQASGAILHERERARTTARVGIQRGKTSVRALNGGGLIAVPSAGMPYASAKQSPSQLHRDIGAHAELVKKALKKVAGAHAELVKKALKKVAGTAPAGKPIAPLPIEKVLEFNRQARQTMSTWSWTDPVKPEFFKLEDKPSPVGPLLMGAAALLALKLLR